VIDIVRSNGVPRVSVPYRLTAEGLESRSYPVVLPFRVFPSVVVVVVVVLVVLVVHESNSKRLPGHCEVTIVGLLTGRDPK